MTRKAKAKKSRADELYGMANSLLYVLFSVQGTLRMMHNEGSIGEVGMEHIFGPINLITDAVDQVVEQYRGVL